MSRVTLRQGQKQTIETNSVVIVTILLIVLELDSHKRGDTAGVLNG